MLGCYPNSIRLPSCMYRLLCASVEPLLKYDATPSSSFSIAGVIINDSHDGT